MNADTKTAFIVFMFVMVAMTLSQLSHAAMNLSPVVPGYSGGTFTSSSGSFSMASANDGYIKPSVVNVAGKPVTVPANLRMASNAGQFAKSAMRLNPWLLAGTLALPWLLDQGMEWSEDHWRITDPLPPGNTYPDGKTWSHGYSGHSCFGTGSLCSIEQALTQSHLLQWPGATGLTFEYVSENSCSPYGGKSYKVYSSLRPAGWSTSTCRTANLAPNPESRPADENDWLGLPDPLPVVGPELPYAPYSTDGVPVDAPEYDFAPFQTPIGEPYTKPDGSTAQPMASVSPNGDSVTVDTYDQPLTNPQGDPLPDAPPVDTPEPQPDSPTQCDKYPNSLGCAELGTVDDLPVGEETRTIAAIAPITTIGGAGSCPEPLTASFMGQTVSFSYDMPCSFATSLKPLILAIAWLSAGLIFIGGVRQ